MSEMRHDIYKTIGKAVLEAQGRYQDREPIEVVPEVVAALLSLANNIARLNMGLSRRQFVQACVASARELP